ncbi:MAG: hypothetical protein OXL38_00285 [Gammaproteobacteria bacterium]|nr:hypothetical protein [Gammaproteobacteria bacterium]
MTFCRTNEERRESVAGVPSCGALAVSDSGSCAEFPKTTPSR